MKQLFFEIGDSSKLPYITKQTFTVTDNLDYCIGKYFFNSEGFAYKVATNLIENHAKNNDIFYTLEVDFYIENKPSIGSTGLTGQNIPFEIVSYVVAITKKFLLQDFPDCIKKHIKANPQVGQFKYYLQRIDIVSKSEYSGDERRHNMYKKFLKKNLESLKIKIINTSDVTQGGTIYYLQPFLLY